MTSRSRTPVAAVAALLTPLLLTAAAMPVTASTAGHRAPPDPVRVVTTLPVYASIAEAIGGAEVQVEAIAAPAEDAHFVRPKPSFALSLRQADLFVTTGLDLELWVPTLLDRAGNHRVSEGGIGYVTAYTGVSLLDVPSSVDRSAGDVHVYGNPHLHTDPLRALQVARNITTGLKRVAPDRAAHFDRGLDRFTDRIYRGLFGDRLVDLVGGRALEELAKSGGFFTFLDTNSWQGVPLEDMLGGWLARAAPFRGQRMICYHKNWAYFEDRFEVRCAEYVEARPGIPPTPRHVARLIEMMQTEGFRVLFAANYFDRGRVESVAQRGGARAVIVPMNPGGTEGVDDYFDLVDFWVDSLASAFRRTS